MRRKEKEIKDLAAMEAIIQEAQVGRLAMCQDNQPYVIPINYGYQDRTVYIHCAKEGRKMDMIAANDKVCFEVDQDLGIDPADKACKFGFKFKSVIGFGRAVVLKEHPEKAEALKIIMDHYADGDFSFTEEETRRVYIIKVELDEITGKQGG